MSEERNERQSVNEQTFLYYMKIIVYVCVCVCVYQSMNRKKENVETKKVQKQKKVESRSRINNKLYYNTYLKSQKSMLVVERAAFLLLRLVLLSLQKKLLFG